MDLPHRNGAAGDGQPIVIALGDRLQPLEARLIAKSGWSFRVRLVDMRSTGYLWWSS